MVGQVSVGQYLAIPFDAFRGPPIKNDRLLDGCLHLPNLFPIPGTVDERRLAVAAWLTSPDHMFWETWHNGNLIGVMGLTRIIPKLDAMAHMAFFDRQLVGRRNLILKMMRWSFENLELQRLTIEVPEHLEPLVRFCRAKLGFRYEGEDLAKDHPIAKAVPRNSAAATTQWIVKVGSRRERAHWSDDGWHDLARLRILREEFKLDQ